METGNLLTSFGINYYRYHINGVFLKIDVGGYSLEYNKKNYSGFSIRKPPLTLANLFVKNKNKIYSKKYGA